MAAIEQLGLAGAVLAGGAASRLAGLKKGLLPTPDGTTIIGHLLDEIKACGIDEMVISANDPESYRGFGLHVVADARKGAGPLAGIEAVLTHYGSRRQAVLFCPCDLPGITRRQLSALVNAFLRGDGPIVMARTPDSFCHPLCAIVPGALRLPITRAIENGARSVQEVWTGLGAVAVEFDDPAPFFNVNTPEDLARWMEERALER